MARRFTIKERIDLVRNYYSSGNNASEAARGVLKAKIYSHNPITLDQLRSLISQQLQTINVSLCRKVCRSVRDRMAKCVQNKGGHFEHLLFSLHYPHLFAQCDL